jgi:hypothetical protein
MATGRATALQFFKKSKIIFAREHSSLTATGPPGSFKWRGMRRIFFSPLISFICVWIRLFGRWVWGTGVELFRKMQSVTISGEKKRENATGDNLFSGGENGGGESELSNHREQSANGENRNKWKQIEGKREEKQSVLSLFLRPREIITKWNRKAPNCLTFYGLAFVFQLDPFYVDGTGSYPLT